MAHVLLFCFQFINLLFAQSQPLYALLVLPKDMNKRIRIHQCQLTLSVNEETIIES